MTTIGIDLGSSSVKLSLLDVNTGQSMASIQLPENEMKIHSPQTGWAEQDPELWWAYIKQGIQFLAAASVEAHQPVKAIGIAYQMHGLVCVDRNFVPVRPSIIWCDSRAAGIGRKAFTELGSSLCLSHLLNSPGNFTASKLAWVKQNEPEIYNRIYKIMLPGDYIALKLSGECSTTASGLSEGMLWDFQNNNLATLLTDYYGFDTEMLPDIVPQFGEQAKVSKAIAIELGLPNDVIISYRAGDQPNNAFSLNVLNPGEVAATAGTSGVVYGVTDQIKYDPLSRVNTFLHVNHSNSQTRLGVLLCINGTGIVNSWLKNNISDSSTYDDMNRLAGSVVPGAEGVIVIPFGNGSERMLLDRQTGCQIIGLQFNRHTTAHVLRAAHEGIAFAFIYGMEVMKETGFNLSVIKAGYANMFLSPVFRQTLATLSGAEIQLYNTDGSLGAARAAAAGCGIYNSLSEAFSSLKILETIYPQHETQPVLSEAYNRWIEALNRQLATV